MTPKTNKNLQTIFVIPLYTILGGLLGYFLSWLIALIFIPQGSVGLNYLYIVIFFIIIGLILGIIAGVKRSRN